MIANREFTPSHEPRQWWDAARGGVELCIAIDVKLFAEGMP
jgi:hypothetical protein